MHQFVRKAPCTMKQSYKVRRYIFLLIVLLTIGQPTWSVVAWSGSGVVGDEWYHYREDTASVDTRRRAPRINVERRRSQAAVQSTFPLKGQVRSIVLLVNYSDIKFTVSNPREAFRQMLNDKGYADHGSTGSASDYFKACSYGAFQPTFDVFGPYDLPKKRSFYGANDERGNDKDAVQMVIDACMLADADGVDFSQYDYNNDGAIDNVFIYYAGTNPAEGGPEEAIWPHRYALYRNEVTLDGKRLYDYACTSELTLMTSRNGTMCGIGTFCHEFGHVLGLPDFYDTARDDTYTVGSWDIMASGSYNNYGCTPPSYSAFERFALGWLQPVQLTNIGDYVLSPLNESPEAYLLASMPHNLSHMNPAPTEYWLVENRQHTGWDEPERAIPGVGLLISHICHVAGRWNDNTYNNFTPLGYDICEAYNQKAVYASASDTYPGTAGITSFTPKQSNGIDLPDLQLSKIRGQGTMMEFHFGGSDGRGFAVSPSELPPLTNYVLNGKSEPIEQMIEITGSQLESEQVFVALGNSIFSISQDGKEWHKDTLWFSATSEPFEATLYLRYEGTRLCRQQVANLHLGTSAHTYSHQVSLIGYAERPTLITDIEFCEPTSGSPYSFVIRWKEQTDAEKYFLTLCKWYEPNEMTQDFELFTTYEKMATTGWQSNFIRTSTTCNDGRTALLMTTAGDEVISERYLSPVTEVSFWLSQSYLASEHNSGGLLRLEATADSEHWQTIADYKLSSVSAATVKTEYFSEDEGYVKFRFYCLSSAGTGGILLDGFKARTERTFEYVYRDEEYPIFAPADSVLISGLRPSTMYSYQLRCVENKGCELHSTPLTPPQFVTTSAGESETSGKMTIIIRDNDMSIYLSSLFVPGAILYFYDLDGHLVTTATPVVGTDECRLPLGLFERGKQYVVKLMNNATSAPKMNRRQQYGKMVIPVI